MKKIILILVITAALSLGAITIPGGDVSGTWSPDDNPFYIDGDITIPVDATLEILPGVEILFNDLYKLTVNGRLAAEGTETDMISFDCIEEATGWQGVRFYNTNDNQLDDSIISYCHFTSAAAINDGEDKFGGALYFNNSSNVVVQNSTFFQNYAGNDGGAICTDNGSDITISNCSFVDNDCGFYGGAFASYGSTNLIQNCVFKDNTASVFAGAATFWNASELTVTDCIFNGNIAGGIGGLYGVSSTLNMVNSTFFQNSTTFGAGGAVGLVTCESNVSNVTIYDNETMQTGAAFWVNGGTLNLANSILWNNTPDEISVLESPTINAANCIITGGFDGFEIYDLDPEFINAAEYDLHLAATSPAIDSGDASLVGAELPETDLDGNPRVQDGDGDGTAVLDMGAYEAPGVVSYDSPVSPSVELTEEGALFSWLEPGSSPGETEELIYDNDESTGAYSYEGYTMSTHMSPAEACQILTLKYYVSSDGAGEFNAEVYNWDGDQPGTTQLHTELVSADGEEWLEIDVSDADLMVDGDFMVGFGSINGNTYLGYDAGLDNDRSWDYDGASTWSPWDEAYLIRAVVQYPGGKVAEIGADQVKPVSAPSFKTGKISVSVNGNALKNSELTGYNVYLDEELVTNTSELSYLFTDLVDGQNYTAGVTAVYTDGESEMVTTEFTWIQTANSGTVPALTSLQGNYPNPFNPETTINFSLAEATNVTIEIYNLKGQKVSTLVSENMDAGNHSLFWKGRSSNNEPVSSGVYFYKMRAGKYTSTKKMILMK
jgi:predicted outer membrane repeat protein